MSTQAEEYAGAVSAAAAKKPEGFQIGQFTAEVQPSGYLLCGGSLSPEQVRTFARWIAKNYDMMAPVMP